MGEGLLTIAMHLYIFCGEQMCRLFGGNMNDEIVIFKTDDEAINVEVRFEDETAWLTQDQMSVLFSKSKSTINEHIKNIFQEGELVESQVMRKFGNSEFTQNLTKMTNFYNLDVIISVGYRVKSLRGTQFRQWATKRLKEYIVKGFTMDDDRLKKLGGGNYWQELLARIRDIRASERRFYQKITDIYAKCSADYSLDSQILIN